MKNYIGIDWGKNKIGTAFGDDEAGIAFGGEMIPNDAQETHSKIYDALISLAHDHDASTFVIGITGHTTQNDNKDAITEFARQIECRSALKIEFVEEMFTTKQAQENLKSAGKKNIAKLDDVEAARILLQSYLDSIKVG